MIAILSRALAAKGLKFTPWQIATFYTALQTKGFVILSGISGTGKTKLAQHFAGLFAQPEDGKNREFVSVRADWRDSKALLGYYNPLAERYERTEFLSFILRATDDYRLHGEAAVARFVILDEMNLARVEYYFADLLSVLESGRDEQGWTREALQFTFPEGGADDAPPRDVQLPPNLYIVGTVNVDETTHAFSPKVLDRAFTLELTEADFSGYPPAAGDQQAEATDAERQALLDQFSRNHRFAVIAKDEIAKYVAAHPDIRQRLSTLNDLLRPHDLHFGYRVFDEIVSFLAAAEESTAFEGVVEGLDAAEAAFDAAVLMKVMPKFHGSRGRLERPLHRLLAWCLDPDGPNEEEVTNALTQVGEDRTVREALSEFDARWRYRKTADRVIRLLESLRTEGFAAFS